MTPESNWRVVGDGVLAVARLAEEGGWLGELKEPASAAELAGRSQLSARAVGMCLDVLCALDVVERVGDGYQRRENPLSARAPWSSLAPFLRSGEVSPHIDIFDNRGPEYRRSVVALSELFDSPARELAAQLREVRSIVDVGAGGGIWSLMMAARFPETRVLGLDLPEVSDCIHVLAGRHDVADRVDTLAGDYFAVTPPTPVDRVVMANVLHLEAGERAAVLVKRFASSLAEDGELVIIDSIGGSSPQRALAHAIYTLHLGMRTERGEPHSLASLRTWASDAGLDEQQLIELDGAGLGLGALVCRRAGRPTPRAPKSEPQVSIAGSDLKKLRDELALLQRRSRYIFDGMTDGLMVISYALNQVSNVNSAFRSLFRLDWGEDDMHDYDQLLAPGDRARFARLIGDMKQRRPVERRHRFTMVRGDGTRFEGEVTCFDPSYRSSAGLAVRDRTEMARRERMDLLGELVGAVVHDINTPLGTLKSSAELVHTLAARVGAGEGARAAVALQQVAADMQRAVERMEALTRSLGAYAKLEGAALKELAPSFGTGVAHAICERIAAEAGNNGRI